jgi:hypothetical protein
MLALPVSENQIISLIAQLDLSSLEKIRKALIKQEIYLKKFQPAPINDIMNDFKQVGYSSEFLADLEQGLKNSSLYTQ